MKKNSVVRVKYIGEDDPLSLRYGKIYEARVLQKDWFGVVDETNENYNNSQLELLQKTLGISIVIAAVRKNALSPK